MNWKRIVFQEREAGRRRRIQMENIKGESMTDRTYMKPVPFYRFTNSQQSVPALFVVALPQ